MGLKHRGTGDTEPRLCDLSDSVFVPPKGQPMSDVDQRDECNKCVDECRCPTNDATQQQPTESVALDIDQSIPKLALMSLNTLDQLTAAELKKLNNYFDGKIKLGKNAKSIIKACECMGWSYMWAVKSARDQRLASKKATTEPQSVPSDE